LVCGEKLEETASTVICANQSTFSIEVILQLVSPRVCLRSPTGWGVSATLRSAVATPVLIAAMLLAGPWGHIK